VRSAHNDLLILCDTHADPNHAAALEAAGIEVVHIAQSNGHLDLNAVLTLLALRQILSLLLECGPQLNGAFLAHGLVDKVVLFHAPIALGEGALPFAAEFGSPLLLEQSLHKITRTNFGADLCVAGLLRDPWG
jgi:diaminohydroxyphosphoribosylaminopyrimidine deaminase/5-amino-6-(5-phosphoribosylamino)uracil reductase